MKPTPVFEFDERQRELLRKARRLEWWTIAFLLSDVTVMYFVLGSSQAMKTQWMENILSLVPPIVFLAANPIANWKPCERFPYGYHRATTIAFLCAAIALFAMGGYLLIDALIKLVSAEHPTIGGITLFGRTFWLGWLMIPVLVWSGASAALLGRLKLPYARPLHDKVLQADATMNKADWMSASATIVGVLGIGLGYWWADAVAAGLVSLSILRDGYTNLREVVSNLMDERPKVVDHSRFDLLPERIREHLKGLDWIRDAEVRMREEGHVFFGEAFVVTDDDVPGLPEKLYRATRECTGLDWRLHDFVLVPVPSLEDEERAEGHRPAERNGRTPVASGTA